KRLSRSWRTFYDLSLNKWYVDEIYQALIIAPGRLLSTHLLWQAFDKNFIDRSVNGSGVLARGAGGLIRGLQDGVMQTYALIFGIGTLTVIWYIF
ncbi:MAG: NADH-quinone oxidoreductase subunit L, partial [SAR324 cluster bacterium]|nr:NADH-quinone oxidoreductase subunit L [SAR324 cluster bacterium]